MSHKKDNINSMMAGAILSLSGVAINLSLGRNFGERISVKNISWLSKIQDKIFHDYVGTKIGSVNCCWRVCSIQCGRIR